MELKVDMGQILAKNNDPSERLSLVDICRGLREEAYKNIVVMCGPAVNAPPEMDALVYNGEGFYGLIESRCDIERASELLSGRNFVADPRPFYVVMHEIYNTRVQRSDVTLVHKFLKVLDKKRMLRRVYTSNVDSGELRAGLDLEKVVEVYGTLTRSFCTNCNSLYDLKWLSNFLTKGNFDTDKGDVTKPKCGICHKGYIKPDVVLFGDHVNERFYRLREMDMKACDLLVVLGSRLSVAPFCELAKMPPTETHRLYINNAKPAYKPSSVYYSFNIKSIFQRRNDVVVTKFPIDDVVGDMCAILDEGVSTRAVKGMGKMKESRKGRLEDRDDPPGECSGAENEGPT